VTVTVTVAVVVHPDRHRAVPPASRQPRSSTLKTMTRLPMLAPADLDDQQRALYDAIAGGPRATGPRLFALTDAAGRLNGPFNAMAILAVAAHWDSAFERYAHEAVGRVAGLTDEELRSLRDGEQPLLDDPAEQAALDVVRALLAEGDVADPLFQRAVSLIGDQAVVELTSLVGYYVTLALQLRVFRVGLPAELPGESA
jgi:4-carboxymuconolactone decarboxylase